MMTWRHAGLVYDDALNNYPPQRLRTGEWMMSRRDRKGDVHYLFGGVAGIGRWESLPAVPYTGSGFEPNEPTWWILPDQTLSASYRDNQGSGYIYRAFSRDDGRTWSQPVQTYFPDAKSKISSLRLQDGGYVLVSNPHPKRRDPLVISISDDGLVFHTMAYLAGGRHVDYPHVIEHGDSLYVAFATVKQTVEVLKIRRSDLALIRNTSKGKAGAGGNAKQP